MRVLLINPSRTYYEKSLDVRLGLPIGIMSIAAVLEEQRFNVKIYDCLIDEKTYIKKSGRMIHHGVSIKDYKNKIKKEMPDIVGISCPFLLHKLKTF